jgi:hypothetical protein
MLDMPPKYKEILMPVNGWEPNAFYLVEIAMSINNPVFRALLFTGFIQDGRPGGYSKIIGPSHDDIMPRRVYYLRPLALVIREKMKPTNEPITVWKDQP